MPIKTITTNVAGRTKDLFISQGVSPYTQGPQPVTYNFGKISSCVVGVQKLIQRYAIALFNTGLAQQLETARSSNIQEATHIFNFASWQVLQTFKDYQSKHPEMPEDEQLATAVLSDVSSSPGKLFLKVTLVTKAGENVDYVLPVALS